MLDLIIDNLIFLLVVAGVISFFKGFYIVNPREEAVLFTLGKFVAVEKEPGYHWLNPIGREIRKISTQDKTLDISSNTVVDVNGSPIIISAIVVYRISNSKIAAIDVENPDAFVADQAGAIIKRVCSKYPYDSQETNEPCLRKESEEISIELISELQESVNSAGIEVISVKFDDLSYAPEIVQSMLMKQQAQAFIEARKTIVDGAVSLVQDATTQLKDGGVKLSKASQEQLISNLLVILCSGEIAQPVVQVQSNRDKA